MRDYAELIKELRCNGMDCDFCAQMTPNGKNCIRRKAADAIEELLEEKRLLSMSVNLQAKIIQHMETVIRANGLPTPPREETE